MGNAPIEAFYCNATSQCWTTEAECPQCARVEVAWCAVYQTGVDSFPERLMCGVGRGHCQELVNRLTGALAHNHGECVQRRAVGQRAPEPQVAYVQQPPAFAPQPKEEAPKKEPPKQEPPEEESPQLTPAEATMAKMAEFKDQMCACRDADCAKSVADEMTAWARVQSQTHQRIRMTVDDQKRATELGTAMGVCMQKAMGMP